MTEINEEKLKELRKNEYVVWYKDEPLSILNERLAIKQDITDSDLEELKALHVEKHIMFLELEKLDSTKDKDIEKLKKGALKLEIIENSLQDTWGLGANSDYHEWYLIPHCTCPKMDNADMKGIDRRIMNSACPVHGSGISNDGIYKPSENNKYQSPVHKDIDDEVEYNHLIGKWVAYDSDDETYTHIGKVLTTSYNILSVESSAMYVLTSLQTFVSESSSIVVINPNQIRILSDLELTMHRKALNISQM